MAAALSMICGTCKAQLRSVDEAQEHAELTGHTDFAESTEPVLNLVCRCCGKPCRTETERDLHTKRTGHDIFDDKTNEVAKPISLEAKPNVTTNEGDSALKASEAEGLPSTEIDGAVDHDNMEAIDANSQASAMQDIPQPQYTPEEAKTKMLELRERARKKKEEEEKRTEKEREKERIRVGKELLEAKRIEEENERKRVISLRKAEKEEEKRAREKIRQKLEEDKAERRRKLGLPPEETRKDESTVVEEKKSFLPVKPASKAERLRECLRSLKQNHKDDEAQVKKAFQTLLTYIGNIVRSPDEEKFRKIRMTNPTFQERVGSLKGGIQFLEICGFEKGGDDFLVLPRAKVDISILNTAGSELNSAIVNPFYGVL